MKIKQVEELVGINSKNIRFYEDQGLLTPSRADNGYREYHEPEIIRLKQIKFLRKLGVPISQIQSLLDDSLSLDSCMRTHLTELEHQKNDIEYTKQVTLSALQQHAEDLDHLNIDECLDAIERSEKEGARFMDLDKTDVHRKKSMGAGLGAGIMIVIMALLIWMILWANYQDPLPGLLLAIVLFFPCVIMVCVIVVLVQRLKEIKGGEEDDAHFIYGHAERSASDRRKTHGRRSKGARSRRSHWHPLQLRTDDAGRCGSARIRNRSQIPLILKCMPTLLACILL